MLILYISHFTHPNTQPPSAALVELRPYRNIVRTPRQCIMYHFHLINCTRFFSQTILPAQLVDLTKSRIHWNAKWWWLNDCDLVGTFRANNKTHTTMSSISDTLHSSFLFTSPFYPLAALSLTFPSAYFSAYLSSAHFFRPICFCLT